MKILAIDTSTKFLCIAVYDNGRMYEYNLELGRKHSVLIIITIKRILDALSLKPQDIDYFSCGIGPGSFTGVRIGVAAIKGLAWSLNKPIIGISSLDILAYNAIGLNGLIVPVIDAKRNLVYASAYSNKNGMLKRIMPYMLASVDDLVKKIKPGSIIFGDALQLYKDQLARRVKRAAFLDKDYWQLRSSGIIPLAIENIRRKKLSNAFDIKPIYLYPKECQIK